MVLWRQMPFLPGVPIWVRVVSSAGLFFVFAQVAWIGVHNHGGVTAVIEGQTVLSDHGRVLLELSGKDYLAEKDQQKLG